MSTAKLIALRPARYGYEHQVIEIHAYYAQQEDNLADLLQQIDDDLFIRQRDWDGKIYWDFDKQNNIVYYSGDEEAAFARIDVPDDWQ